MRFHYLLLKTKRNTVFTVYLLSIIENSPPLEGCPQDGVAKLVQNGTAGRDKPITLPYLPATFPQSSPYLPATFPQQAAIKFG
jgi:hypothetical protein